MPKVPSDVWKCTRCGKVEDRNAIEQYLYLGDIAIGSKKKTGFPTDFFKCIDEKTKYIHNESLCSTCTNELIKWWNNGNKTIRKQD